MKPFIIFLLFLNSSWHLVAQKIQLQIIGQTNSQTEIIDSLKYNTKHENIKSINEEINKFSKNLLKIGYIDNTSLGLEKVKDSSFIAKFNLGTKINSIHLYIGTDPIINNLICSKNTNNTIEIIYPQIDLFLKQIVEKLEQDGYSLAKLKLVNIEKKGNTLYADLKLEKEIKRKLNSITVQYLEKSYKNKFTKGALKQINKKYQNAIFNQNTVEKIYKDFNKFGFVNQIKYPEILFTKDTTRIYVYLEKRNSNTFDGFLGFSNTETKKINLTGYLDVTLENILGSAEQFSIYWKSDGNDQKTFKGSLELPYLFKTPMGLKAQLKIFRQDSTFQNTKTSIDLSYYIDHSSRIYLGYETTESSDIQNLNTTSVSDFNNSFITSSFEYTKQEKDNFLFPNRSEFKSIIAIGKRETNNSPENSTSKQVAINLNAMHTFYLNQKNSINLNTQNNYLLSNTYLNNELFHIGGLGSIRGFAENSLQGYLSACLLTEFRHLLSPALYIHTILDYSLLKNKSRMEKISDTSNLLGFGLGIGLKTKNGLFKLAAANGKINNQNFEIYNTLIHISYNVKF